MLRQARGWGLQGRPALPSLLPQSQRSSRLPRVPKPGTRWSHWLQSWHRRCWWVLAPKEPPCLQAAPAGDVPSCPIAPWLCPGGESGHSCDTPIAWESARLPRAAPKRFSAWLYLSMYHLGRGHSSGSSSSGETAQLDGKKESVEEMEVEVVAEDSEMEVDVVAKDKPMEVEAPAAGVQIYA